MGCTCKKTISPCAFCIASNECEECGVKTVKSHCPKCGKYIVEHPQPIEGVKFEEGTTLYERIYGEKA